MPRILVTDAEQRSSLAVVRSLGRAGYHVDVCSAAARPLAGASRYVTECHRVPDPAADVSEFLRATSTLIEQRGVDVLIPMTDVTASVALRLRAAHPGLLIPLPPADVWERVSDKRALMEIARSLGVPVPEQHVVAGPDADAAEAVRWARARGFPVIVKPHRSAVVGESSVSRLGVGIAADAAELDDRLRRLPPEAFPVMVQEKIAGPGLGAFFLARDGEVILRFAHRRLREKPPTGGVSVLREGVPLREDLAAYSEALLEHVGWSGVAMVEFKEDASTGTPYLMEINGRFWGSLQLAIDCGVDFPRALIESFSTTAAGASSAAPPSGARSRRRPHGPRPLDAPGPPSSPDPTAGPDPTRRLRSRWLWGDVDHLIWILRADAAVLRADAHLPGRLRAMARFLLPSWRTRYEVLRLTDPGPFLRESRQWLAHAAGRAGAPRRPRRCTGRFG